MAGGELNKSISKEIESSQIILLLVSANFLASDYCYEKEMIRAMEKHEEESAVVIPVILHPCDWHSSPFGKLRATPTDGKPVSMYANQHEAFSIVAKDIREAIENLPKPTASETNKHELESHSDTSQNVRSSNLRIKRKFSDHERDNFLENSYDYMALYFEGSLQELANRNPHIKIRFKRLDGTSFAAFIYSSGDKVAECSVYYGNRGFGSNTIAFSHSGDAALGSFNEQISVVYDGFTLQLKALGMSVFSGQSNEPLSQQGAAELFWSLFIRNLQA